MSQYTNLRNVYQFNSKYLIRRCLSYFRPYIFQISIGFLSLFIISGCSALLAYLIKPAMDGIFINADRDALLWVPWAVVGVTLLKGVFRFLQNYLLDAMGLRVLEAVRNDLFDKVMDLPMRYFDESQVGMMLSRVVGDAAGIRQSLPSFIMLLREVATGIGLIGVVFYQNAYLACWAVFVLPFAVYPFAHYSKKLRKLGRRGQQQAAEINSFVLESFSGIRVIKAFAKEDHELADFHRESRRVTGIGVRSVFSSEMSSRFMELVGALGSGLVLWYGGQQVIEGHSTPGTFFSFMAALVMLYDPIKRVSSYNLQIQKALASAERVFGLLDSPEIRPEEGGDVELEDEIRSVAFEHLTFHYPDTTRPALDDLDLTIAQGDRIAVVGPSGAGKTTLANLIPRFYDPQQGRILINERDIREYTLSSLRMRIGIVSQDTFLFNMSVRENIAYTLGEHSREAIEEAARAAYAHEFIQQLPRGYDTIVGERGVMLSGGQKQRLTIARALLKNPPLLILDEATSALDTQSERIVQKALDNLMQNRTSIVIAHRLSTILNADRILVMERGKVIASGPHTELLGCCELYRTLHERQFRQHDG